MHDMCCDKTIECSWREVREIHGGEISASPKETEGFDEYDWRREKILADHWSILKFRYFSLGTKNGTENVTYCQCCSLRETEILLDFY